MAEKSDCAGARYPNTAECFCLEGKFKKKYFYSCYPVFKISAIHRNSVYDTKTQQSIKCWIFGIMSRKIAKTYPNGHMKTQ